MRLILLLIFVATFFTGFAQSISFGNKAKIYLVRHAEKGPGEDPLLTSDGNKRAGDLLRAMKNKKIRHVYVTEYKRTQNTGDSIRLQLGIDTVHYLSDTSCIDLMNKLIANKDVNKSILIIGHSNTIPLIIRKLGLPDYPKDYIPANEFDNLFLLTFKDGRASLKKMKYGAVSGSSATMQ